MMEILSLSLDEDQSQLCWKMGKTETIIKRSEQFRHIDKVRRLET